MKISQIHLMDEEAIAESENTFQLPSIRFRMNEHDYITCRLLENGMLEVNSGGRALNIVVHPKAANHIHLSAEYVP